MNKTTIRRMIKAGAVRDMQGSWLRSFVATLISFILPFVIMGFLPFRIPSEAEIQGTLGDTAAMLALFLPRVITAKTIASYVVTAVLYLIVMCPFSVGVSRFYLEVARGEKAKLKTVFSVFSELRTVFSSIWLNVIIFAAQFLLSFAAMVLPMVFMTLGMMIGSTFIVILSTVLIYISLLLVILWTSRYTIAMYVFAEGKSGGAWKSFREAQRIMRGRGSEMITLRASYFGWDIACSLAIPALSFVYHALCGTVYAKYLYYLRDEMFFGEQGFPPVM